MFGIGKWLALTLQYMYGVKNRPVQNISVQKTFIMLVLMNINALGNTFESLS